MRPCKCGHPKEDHWQQGQACAKNLADLPLFRQCYCKRFTKAKPSGLPRVKEER